MAKREQLETAMRRKLEAELRKARESNLQLKGKNKQGLAHLAHADTHGEFQHTLGPNVQYEIFALRCHGQFGLQLWCKQTKFQLLNI